MAFSRGVHGWIKKFKCNYHLEQLFMQKIILHLDFNSYFASVEQQANPFLRGKAIAVAGKSKHSIDVSKADKLKTRFNVDQSRLHRTVITTASREAKKLGVKTAMSSLEARRMVPELIIIPGDPKKYSEVTARFLAILRRYADAVEQFSTDEAFADITYAAQEYFGATMIAQRIRNDIKQEIGEVCTVSIGIAPNKLVAKLAGESVKPNGLTVVRPEHVELFVTQQPLEAVCGIGSRIEHRLNALGISSIASLQEASMETLRNEFKEHTADFLYGALHGMGDDDVCDIAADPKSVGHSYTFPHDLESPLEMQINLLALCDKVAWRMRRDGFVATEISVYARYSDFGGAYSTKRVRDPMEDGLSLYKTAWTLLESIRHPHERVRLLGVSARGLLKTEQPRSLFKKDEKMHLTLRALDTIQERYGSGIWSRAATMKTDFKERISGWHYDHEV